MFNSGIIPYGGFFQYTFDRDALKGKFVYHCEIHPWRENTSLHGCFLKLMDTYLIDNGVVA
jgi:hypothetical protein